MMGLANGNFDATGNRVWLGAYLFLHFFGRRDTCMHLHQPTSELITSVEKEESLSPSQMDMSNQISKLRQLLFRNRTVVELGCGTGVSGLSLLKSQHDCPKSLHLTDCDETSIDLCRKNCEENVSYDGSSCINLCTFELLKWRIDYGDTSTCECAGNVYDTVIATDVLYDLASLKPLMHTASALLEASGYFVLSHVPRACIEGNDSGVSSSKLLEECICKKARSSGFGDASILRPEMIIDAGIGSTNCDELLQEMKESGAAILIFKKMSIHDEALY
uniref:Methyltransferase domain-containing protein n=2 Tax=Leptocylindrus danicus TaxID=163516 RepID=A0A7S2PGQ6_9STRA|mmetsp:Transcript_33236/g.48090  ORF Transcript_33236/g.48090 Transcript_33236/m.48090 type:complete len:276 (+) Transcript_33236:29-856(+)